MAWHDHRFMVEITGINIAIGGGGGGGEGEVDQGSIFLSFQVNIAHFGDLFAKYFVEGCLHFMTADCNGKISGLKAKN